jgi:hypothetical protein
MSKRILKKISDIWLSYEKLKISDRLCNWLKKNTEKLKKNKFKPGLEPGLEFIYFFFPFLSSSSISLISAAFSNSRFADAISISSSRRFTLDL